jgi:lysophospholipase L1-like esterase
MPRTTLSRTKLCLAFAAALASTPAAARATHTPELPAGSRYVAMGSSFAAGPGIAMEPTTQGGRCWRSPQNYPRQLARRLHLSLVDVSCSGATTEHLLGPWADLPPQINAVTPETRLVTITIGGNDLAYVGGLIMASCREAARAQGGDGAKCPVLPAPDEARYARMAANLGAIAAAVRQGAPSARLVFVEYLTILPDADTTTGTCAAIPLPAGQAETSRAIASRLAAITDAAARAAKAEVIPAALSHGHDACSAEPWVSGYSAMGHGPVPYHPNLAGMTALADALATMLRAPRETLP